MRHRGDVGPLIAIAAAHGDRHCLARASTGGTEKQNCKSRRLTSRGSPFSVTSTWVAGEARAKIMGAVVRPLLFYRVAKSGEVVARRSAQRVPSCRLTFAGNCRNPLYLADRETSKISEAHFLLKSAFCSGRT